MCNGDFGEVWAEAIARLERSPQGVWVAMDPESTLVLAELKTASHKGGFIALI